MSNQQLQKATPTTVRVLLEKMKERLSMALPAHLTADRMIMMATTSVSRNPKLLECSQTSLIGAILQAAQIGLEPDGVLGQAYLIPFKGQVQFIPGYKGLVNLAYRSQTVRSFQARVVHEGDTFEYELGLEEKLKHIPCGTTGKLTHVYAVITFKDGGKMFEVMTRDQVQLIRNKSQGKNNPVWSNDEEEMSKKTVIRRLAKVAPLSPEFQKAVALDEAHFELGKEQKNQYDTLVDVPEFANEIDNEVGTDAEVIQEEEAATAAASSKSKAEKAMQGLEGKITTANKI